MWIRNIIQEILALKTSKSLFNIFIISINSWRHHLRTHPNVMFLIKAQHNLWSNFFSNSNSIEWNSPTAKSIFHSIWFYRETLIKSTWNVFEVTPRNLMFFHYFAFFCILFCFPPRCRIDDDRADTCNARILYSLSIPSEGNFHRNRKEKVKIMKMFHVLANFLHLQETKVKVY